MNNILKGSKAIRESLERGNRGESKFLKMEDGESLTIRFMQELDETGSQYAENRGVAYGYYEHIDPDDFSKSFVCTQESEGKCTGCERVTVNRRWRSRGRLVANVLVRGKRGEPDKVKVFSTSISSKGLTPALVEYADEYGSLCDRDYKITRRGSGIETTYTLLPREVALLTKEDESVELITLDSVMRNLTYEEQQDLLGGVSSNGKSDW